MSLRLLASGALISDPQSRESAKRPFTTATLRAEGDEPVLVSIIAFGDESRRLLELAKGDELAVLGRARLTIWTGRDGVERHGLSVMAEQLTTLKHPKSVAGPRRHGGRRPYSVPRSAEGSSGPVADDRLDDLWNGLLQ
jgi:single-stranded DNA-binding protein